MSIIKSKHASNYTILPNEVFKHNLSLSAIGLLSYFLSLPHDWVIHKTQIHKTLGVGREKLHAAFSQLVEVGYVVSVKKHLSNGKFEYEHIVYDKPYNGEPCTAKPLTVKPLTAQPCTVNPQLLSTNIQSKQLQSKQEESKLYKNKKNILEIWFEDLPNSQNLELISISLSIQKEILIKRISDFKKAVNVSYKNFDDFCNHFKNWIKKNPTTTQTKNKELK